MVQSYLRKLLMGKEIIFLVEEDPEGGFIAKSPKHAIITQAETIEDLKIMIQDAVRCHYYKKTSS